MKAIILEKAGGTENLQIKEIEKPVLNETEVLVKVKAISLNAADKLVRSSEDRIKFVYGRASNVILGWDISGTVSSVGDKVTKFKVGDNVFGMVNFLGAGNAYAEFVASPEDHLAKMPNNVNFEEAAATTMAALTALKVLQNNIKENDRVLVHGGSGGVGHFGIQIAKSFGAHVITTSSAKNKDFVLSIGADEHIDYTTQAFEEVVKDIDFVLDAVGGEVLFNSLKVMKNGGSIISLPDTPPILEEVQNKAENNVKVSTIMVLSNGEDMNTLSTMLAEGKIKPAIYKTFPFSEMKEAHAVVESGRAVGKVIVTI